MIVDRARAVPVEWTDAEIVELFHHARDLGLNGNPAGFFLTIDLFPFVGIEEGERRTLKPQAEWDYPGARAWIAENPDRVGRVWGLGVMEEWW